MVKLRATIYIWPVHTHKTCHLYANKLLSLYIRNISYDQIFTASIYLHVHAMGTSVNADISHLPQSYFYQTPRKFTTGCLYADTEKLMPIYNTETQTIVA